LICLPALLLTPALFAVVAALTQLMPSAATTALVAPMAAALAQAVESVSRIFHRRFRRPVMGTAIFLIEISH
jgi:hypothetical protein